jgi:hypothetical protein
LKPNKIRYLETKGRSEKKAKRATKDLKKKEANLLRWRYLFWGICRTSRRKNKKNNPSKENQGGLRKASADLGMIMKRTKPEE